jgi:hypothetical protein
VFVGMFVCVLVCVRSCAFTCVCLLVFLEEGVVDGCGWDGGGEHPAERTLLCRGIHVSNYHVQIERTSEANRTCVPKVFGTDLLLTSWAIFCF